ncbi:twin-arginine translocase subunit TatB [Sphingomonas changnyeongensis]|uniref:Twin-arginine translocase subunit TatB n=1 Tax=Sphingomonas changnyeongensis TaxID=2698679 RepID=A0A7Z2S4T3_9SPHN|nr:Sec-independent protein translocase protein TatB [Sphingomonas changnyeongensis]QHL89608.1 twin-arginine translocase subunit TatB [Sphingomonas changnyeongensis]
MFDIAPQELLLCAIVALVVIGPKDLPRAMRVLGHWVAKVRGAARHFRSGFDAMVREAELEEMQRKWAEENARIMREHPPVPPVASPVLPDATDAPGAGDAAPDAAPEMTPLPPPMDDKPAGGGEAR